MHRKKTTPRTSTSRSITSLLAESKNTRSQVASVSMRTKIAIGATAVCGIALTASYWFASKNNDVYTITSTNPPFPIHETDFDFRMADAPFNDLYELMQVINSTNSALITGAALYLKDAITKEIPCAVSGAVYNWLKKPIKIAFTESNKISHIVPGAPEAITFITPRGDGFGGQMLFLTPVNFIKKRMLTAFISNEAFHVICLEANNAKITNLDSNALDAIDVNMINLPFLNQFGTIDLKLRKKYYSAISNFVENLDAVNSIVNKSSKLTQVERDKLRKANEALHDYQPNIGIHVLSKDSFNLWKSSLGKKFEVGIIIPKTNSIEGLARDKAARIEAIEEQSNGNVKIYYSNHGTSKAEIFAADYQQYISRIFTALGYKDIDDDHKMMEVGSDINMLPPHAREYFANDLCEYMGDYIGIGKDQYCISRPR